MKKIIMTTIMSIMLLGISGCLSTTIKVSAAQSYEGRYPETSVITIDGKKIKIPEGKSIWILTNDTLFNLLENAKGR